MDYIEVDPWMPTGANNYTVDISTTVPTSEGVYYLIFVCGPEMDVGDLMSCTNWAYGSEVWDDGNDVVDATSTALANAVSHGYVNYTILFSDATYRPAQRGTAVIRVEVTS